jgi:hypothetical protein
MITKSKHIGGWEVTCDFCSTEVLEIECNDFSDVINVMKDNGWKVYKDRSGEWVHECFDCGT